MEFARDPRLEITRELHRIKDVETWNVRPYFHRCFKIHRSSAVDVQLSCFCEMFLSFELYVLKWAHKPILQYPQSPRFSFDEFVQVLEPNQSENPVNNATYWSDLSTDYCMTPDVCRMMSAICDSPRHSNLGLKGQKGVEIHVDVVLTNY